jgi:hypothetical protein
MVGKYVPRLLIRKKEMIEWRVCMHRHRRKHSATGEEKKRELIIETSLLKPRNPITWQKKGNNDIESSEIVTEDDRCGDRKENE